MEFLLHLYHVVHNEWTRQGCRHYGQTGEPIPDHAMSKPAGYTRTHTVEPQYKMESPRNDLIAPQHLDRALYVTTPKAWLGLCMLLVMTAAAVVWAIVGEVASYVHGDGIVLRRGGAIFDAVASHDGKLVQHRSGPRGCGRWKGR